jgi:hypothetical protein
MLYSDTLEKPVLSAIVVAADPLVAENTAGCQTLAVNIKGVKQLGMLVFVEDRNLATKLFVKVRFSGKAAPSIANVVDWGMVCVDNIDGATGISTVQEYMIEVDLLNVNGVANAATSRTLILRIEQISGLHASAIVWCDADMGPAEVFFVQLGG